MRGVVWLLLSFLSVCQMSMADQEALIEEARAEHSDFKRAYELHEKLHQSTMPSSEELVEVVSNFGPPVRELAIRRASHGSLVQILAAIPIILETRDRLGVPCSPSEISNMTANLRRQRDNPESREITIDRIALACGPPLRG